jgi:hypothetical protein
MATTIRIVFFGLVSHIGNKHSKQHAALIDDYPTHVPRIHFNGGGGVPLGRTKITFEDENGRQLERTADSTHFHFQSFVPHLLELTNGDIKRTVAAGLSNPAVYLYVEYPGGKLRPRSLYDCAAKYTMPGKIVVHCVAKTVLLTAEVDAEKVYVVYTNADGNPKRDEVTGCIMISNAELLMEAERKRLEGANCESLMSRHEFERHMDITDASQIAELNVAGKCGFRFEPPDDGDCEWIDATIKNFRDSLEVECGNSQYP